MRLLALLVIVQIVCLLWFLRHKTSSFRVASLDQVVMPLPSVRRLFLSFGLKTELQPPTPFLFQQQCDEVIGCHPRLLAGLDGSSTHSFRHLPKPYQLLVWLL